MSNARSHDRQGIALLVGSSALLGAGFALALLVERAMPALDPVTLQAAGRASEGSVSVLLDLTDPMTPAQRGRLEVRLRGLEREELRANDLLSVWELSSTDEGPLRRLYARYYPGRDANPLWSNPGRVAARCDSLFWVPLVAALGSLPTRPQAHRSPILSAVRELSEQADFVSSMPRRDLVVVSDLAENSGIASFYRSQPDFEAFRTSAAFPAVRANLRGARVHVLYMTRPNETAAAGAHLREFWRAYFNACGASAVEMRRL
jgi:hypothetical protein